MDAMTREAWAALGGDPELLGLVRVTGEPEGLLPAALPALPAMLAAVSASVLAASVLDGARAGRAPEPVTVDVEHVALAARSERYARAEGDRSRIGFAPLSRFWRTADGWLRLHANYPWHAERALRVLRCDSDPAAVEAAVRSRATAELEDALAAAGALGYGVRELADWQAHPQARAVAELPLVTGTPGGGPVRALGPGRGASGVRVLDLTRVIAGPEGTRMLAAWGADVLRIDSPRLPEFPAQALDMLPGKRSAELDFALLADREVLTGLLDRADVLVQGYRPGALARFGLTAEDLATSHPHLSVITLSAWGGVGPWARRRGFDSLVQCPTGIARAEGTAEQPGALPAQVLDHATGYLVAAAALLALAGVARGEEPGAATLSLARTAQWLTDHGPTERGSERELDPAPYLRTLPGGPVPVQVIGPPGRAGDLTPEWRATTTLGADEPAFG